MSHERWSYQPLIAPTVFNGNGLWRVSCCPLATCRVRKALGPGKLTQPWPPFHQLCPPAPFPPIEWVGSLRGSLRGSWDDTEWKRCHRAMLLKPHLCTNLGMICFKHWSRMTLQSGWQGTPVCTLQTLALLIYALTRYSHTGPLTTEFVSMYDS